MRLAGASPRPGAEGMAREVDDHEPARGIEPPRDRHRRVAAALADRTRARTLEELLGGPALPAGALAARVGVAPSTVTVTSRDGRGV